MGQWLISVQNQETGEEMRNWMKNAGLVALVGAGCFAVGTGAASADNESNNFGSLLSGNQVEAPISVPVNVSGNALGLLGGFASAHGAPTHQEIGPFRAYGRRGPITTNRGSVLSGNQAEVPVSVPVNVCGNAAAAVQSVARASCQETTQTISAPQDAPMQACGNASMTWSVEKSTCKAAPIPAPAAPAPVPAEPTIACQPVAPATKAPCEEPSSVRAIPASPFSVTSMEVPTRRLHAAAQEVTTYEKLTRVKQAAGSAADALQAQVSVPSER
jgi:hypothetical protein